MRTVSLLALITLGFVHFTALSRAHAEGPVVINVETKAKRGLYPMAVPTPFDGDPVLAKLVAEVQAFDLNASSWFTVLDPQSFLADLKKEGMSIEPRHWKDVGAFGVIKSRVVSSGAEVTIQFKLYELEKGAIPALEREYRGPQDQVRKLVHKWCNEVVKHFTREPGFFRSSIAFTAENRSGRSIYVMDFDGHGARSLTNNSSINILPAIAPSGTRVAFTSYMRGNPDLYVTSTAGGRPRRITKFPGMNTGASWSPDGSKIALTLTTDGNPEIYVVSAQSGGILARLTSNRYIDTSPAWSPDGSEIAFVSNREGSPQVFVMSADGSSQRRVSLVGNYNQTPSWCPRKGTRILAYTARDDASGRFDIVTLDLATGTMTRITQGQGNNEEPTWAPGGRVIAFASRRAGGSGIYLANADGSGEQRLVYRGNATSPDWGPVP
ncbi:MAG: PD40 domain-containing protein [Deltaproteobacteria bacterium]|nr:PD40 domain-containing protein [Deltaproteobacteria bacterium]